MEIIIASAIGAIGVVLAAAIPIWSNRRRDDPKPPEPPSEVVDEQQDPVK